MKLRDMINTYLTGAVSFALGIAEWAYFGNRWFAVVCFLAGAASIVARLLIKSRKTDA